MNSLNSLQDKIRKNKCTIGVLGLGRVGLPLATVFATKGLQVIGIDIDKNRIDSLKNSICPFHDPPLQENIIQAISSGKLQVFENIQDVEKEIDVFIITVGTPTSENSVDYSQLYKALEEISGKTISGKLIVLRSTLAPKTTTEIIVPYLESKTSLKSGIDFALTVCPERILEGKAIEELNNLPEIVGGINEISNSLVVELFKKINPNKEFLFTSPTGAELAKLFVNIYRYIGFALSNELAVWAERYGVDCSELIKIANYNYPRSNIPIPGFVGGPCLSKDGLFLDINTTFSSIISTAWKLNESIPQHVVNSIKKSGGNLFNKKISVLGLSFKAGSDDLRNSPSVKLVELLRSVGANVKVHDPFVKETLPISDVLSSCDIVILATNHKEFKNLVPDIRKSGCTLVYDVWSVFNKKDFEGINYIKLGYGQ